MFRSLAILTHDHVGLQGPLLVEMSGFSLTAAAMRAKGVEKKRRSTKEEPWRSHANRNVSNDPLLNQRNVDVDLISEAGIENEGGQRVSVLNDGSKTDS